MQITLMRHGRPTYPLAGWIPANRLGETARGYHDSGIADSPTGAAIRKAEACSLVLCSSLRRSCESARKLGHTSEGQPLYAEAAIPYFSHGRLCLPVTCWSVILRLLWLQGFSRNGEAFSSVRLRAGHAATTLEDMAKQHQNILLVGHAGFNQLIAWELRRRGWRGPLKSSYRYWGYSSYRRR